MFPSVLVTLWVVTYPQATPESPMKSITESVVLRHDGRIVDMHYGLNGILKSIVHSQDAESWGAGAFSSDGSIAATMPGLKLYEWDVSQAPASLLRRSGFTGQTLFADHELLTRQAIIFLWDANTFQISGMLRDNRPIAVLRSSPDHRLLTTGGHRFPNVGAPTLPTLAVWRTHDASKMELGTAFEDRVTCLEYSADGRVLAVAGPTSPFLFRMDNGDYCYRSYLHLVNVSTIEKTMSVVHSCSDISCVALNATGEVLLTGSGRAVKETSTGKTRYDDSVIMWNCLTGKEVHRFRLGTGPVTAIRFSTDGRLFAAAGGDNLIQIWDLNGRKRALSLMGHENTVNRIEFSLDRRRLVSGSDDKTVRIWNIDEPAN